MSKRYIKNVQDLSSTSAPKISPQAAYNNSRYNLLLLIAFSAINLIAVLARADFRFLFTASIPYTIAVFGQAFADVYEIPQLFYVFFVFAVIIWIPYLLCYLFSKKSVGWMTTALVLFAIDSAFLIFLSIIWFDISEVVSIALDIVFHIWALLNLTSGVKYGRAMKKMSLQDVGAPDGDVVSSLDGSVENSADDTTVENDISAANEMSVENIDNENTDPVPEQVASDSDNN